jgi:hypothetical protein
MKVQKVNKSNIWLDEIFEYQNYPLLSEARIITEKEQRLLGSESE